MRQRFPTGTPEVTIAEWDAGAPLQPPPQNGIQMTPFLFCFYSDAWLACLSDATPLSLPLLTR